MIKVFDSYEDFLNRDDKSINGCSHDFFSLHGLNEDNDTTFLKKNIGCWNCLDCIGCTDCIDCEKCYNGLENKQCKFCDFCTNCIKCISCEKCNSCDFCEDCYCCNGAYCSQSSIF